MRWPVVSAPRPVVSAARPSHAFWMSKWGGWPVVSAARPSHAFWMSKWPKLYNCFRQAAPGATSFEIWSVASEVARSICTCVKPCNILEHVRRCSELCMCRLLNNCPSSSALLQIRRGLKLGVCCVLSRASCGATLMIYSAGHWE